MQPPHPIYFHIVVYIVYNGKLVNLDKMVNIYMEMLNVK